MKYHDESTKVSSVSVSRNAGAPHVGHATCFHVGWRSSGLPGTSKLTSSGSVTGSWSLGTATGPPAAQWTIGIGVPQARQSVVEGRSMSARVDLGSRSTGEQTHYKYHSMFIFTNST